MSDPSPASGPVTIHVRYLGPLRSRLGVRAEDLGFDGVVTVRRVLERLIDRHGPDMRDVFFNQYGWMDPRLWVLVDGESAGARRGLDTPLSGREDIQIVLGQPISGG
jgi:molybdopterin converting factor small subunit